MPSMDELMGERLRQPTYVRRAENNGTPELNADKNSKDTASSKRQDRTTENSSNAGLTLSNMPTMDQLLKNGAPPPPATVRENDEERASGQNSSRHRKTDRPSSSRRAPSLPKQVVIDGSNICRFEADSSYTDCGCSSLNLLLKLTIFLTLRQARFRCIFDASERFALARNARWPESAAVYQMLLRHAGDFFTEAPAGQSADELILRRADKDKCSIVSNDRFNKLHEGHMEKFPWLQAAEKRLIRVHLNKNGQACWPLLDFSASFEGNPRDLADELLKYL